MDTSTPPPDRSPQPLELWCDVFPSVSETFVAAEARQLAALGHPVHVAAAERGGGTPPEGALTVTYVWEASTATRLRAMAAVAIRCPRRCLADLRDRRRWRAEEPVPPLRTLAPDILRLQRSGATVHAHFATGPALRAMRASRILARPWSLTAHAYDIYARPANLTEKLRAAGLVTSGCAYTVADLRALAGPQAAGRVHEIVMGVDPERFRRTGARPRGRHIVAVGRLVEKKGFVHLVRALADPGLPEVSLTIAGDGTLASALGAEADRIGVGDRVTLAGALDADGVRALLARADVLAMPCVIARDGDRDSMPVVVKEAMAMEVPVVVSDAVGLPELVDATCGRVVATGDVIALARALREVLDLDAPARAALGRAGRARVCERANLRRETGRLSDLLRSLATPRRSGRGRTTPPPPTV